MLGPLLWRTPFMTSGTEAPNHVAPPKSILYIGSRLAVNTKYCVNDCFLRVADQTSGGTGHTAINPHLTVWLDRKSGTKTPPAQPVSPPATPLNTPNAHQIIHEPCQSSLCKTIIIGQAEIRSIRKTALRGPTLSRLGLGRQEVAAKKIQNATYCGCCIESCENRGKNLGKNKWSRLLQTRFHLFRS